MRVFGADGRFIPDVRVTHVGRYSIVQKDSGWARYCWFGMVEDGFRVQYAPIKGEDVHGK